MTQRPPPCRICLYPDKDDKQRVLIKFINRENGRKSYAVKCPNMKDLFGKSCMNFKWLQGLRRQSGKGFRKEPKTRNVPGFISKTLTKEKLEDMYYNQEKSLQDIASEYNCTRQMVKLLMAKYGLLRRGKSKSRMLAIKKGKVEGLNYYDINKNFFSIWSAEMVWVLGLLFTDGYIQESVAPRVTLCSVDLELLIKVKNLLNSSKPIKKRVQSYDKSKHIYNLDFYRKKMSNDLINLGLVQRKSLTMIFPNVPKEYMRHFIRGCWDGDGSVYMSKGKLNVNFTSGSMNFIERLVQELYKIGIWRTKLVTAYYYSQDTAKLKIIHAALRNTYPHGKYPLSIYKSKRSKSYSIKLNSRENLETFFHYLYDGVDESMYLTRKLKKYVEGLGLKS